MGQNFCSFKVKTHDEKVRFCRNPYNVTGLCQRGVCPLSNSQYATVIQHEDELYLYIKTAERAHLPRRQWQKIKLDVNFPKALAQIDDQLQWWDQKLVNKVKARLLRLKQYLMRKRKMLMQPKVQYVSVNKRLQDKLLRRQQKAEAAARIQLEIEKQLLDRLRKGTYDSVINYNKQAFEKFLDQQEDHAQFDELQHEQEQQLPQFVMEDDEEDEQDEEDIDEDYSDDNDDQSIINARKHISKVAHRTIGLKRKGVEREKLMIEEEVEREVPARQRIRSEDLDW